MTRRKGREIAEYNMGRNLDDLACLDPRGYGVCKILHDAAARKAGGSFSMAAARRLDEVLEPGDTVYFLTGFVLSPYDYAETDGIIGTIMLARALTLAYDIEPVVFCPAKAGPGVRALAEKAGFHTGGISDMPRSEDVMFLAQEDFAVNAEDAEDQTAYLIHQPLPKACISVEAPGANAVGEYHNAGGLSVTAVEAKLDLLFEALQAKDVFTLSIGDLGNEIGMSTLAEDILKYIPYTGKGECHCNCGGGILARTSADCVVVGTTSDWGAYALCGAISFINEYLDAFPSETLVTKLLTLAGTYDLIDMYGEKIPAVDGFSLDTNIMVLAAMGHLLQNQQEQAIKSEKWFRAVAEKHFFDGK